MTASTYRSSTAKAAIDAEHRRLDLHRTDRETGRCGACGRTGPCPDANDAAVFLAERGQLIPAARGGPIRILRRAWYRLRTIHRTCSVTPGRDGTNSPMTG